MDDTTLISLILSAISKKISLFNDESMHQKCKIMSPENDNIFINGDTVENVNSFVFIGSSVPSTTEQCQEKNYPDM